MRAIDLGFLPGDSLYIGGTIKAEVIRVTLYPGGLAYTVAYWHNGDRKEVCVEEFEVSPCT